MVVLVASVSMVRSEDILPPLEDLLGDMYLLGSHAEGLFGRRHENVFTH